MKTSITASDLRQRLVMLLCNFTLFNNAYTYSVGWDIVVGIATRYGLDGPEIETRWERDFPHPSRRAL